MAKLSLLMLTAAVAGTAMIGNAVGLAMPVEPAAPGQTRLGAAISDDIGARDKTANQRSRALDLRERAVRAAEARLQAGAPPAPAGTAPGSSTTPPPPDQFDELARIYQAMKPAAAALVMEQLDIEVQTRVAQKMRERSTAMILTAMNAKSAARLTMALAGRRGAPTAPPTPPRTR